MANDSPQELPKTILIHYIKSPMYRTAHADGIYGGITPQRNIHMSFWSERTPIPQLIEHEIKPDGFLGNEIIGARIGKTGLVREVDFDVVLSLETAKAMIGWLSEKVMALEAHTLQSKEEKHG
jgi:hypothetical protein